MSLNDITVGIKTFYRTEKLEKTLQALIDKDFYQILIADDGESDREKDLLYDRYRSVLPLEVLKLPHDTGLPYGRNQMIERCKTPFFLMLDDDQVIPENIGQLKTILTSDPELGGVSCYWDEYGEIVCRGHDIFLFKNHVIKDLRPDIEVKSIEGLRYYELDFIPNSTLYRIEVYDEIKWDDDIKIGSEHIDFYLNHKLYSNWKFAVTPDVVIGHFPSKGSGSYEKKFRRQNQRILKFKQMFLDKWTLKGLINGIALHNKHGLKGRVIHKAIVNRDNWWGAAYFRLYHILVKFI